MKKALCIIIVCLMLASSIALSRAAHASSTFGTCGESLTWTLEGGVLSISGAGDMYDYSFVEESDGFVTDAPWREYRDEVTSLVIEEGVASVGTEAFEGMRALTSAVIPGSAAVIGKEAFLDCTSLSSLTLSEGIEEIEVDAFSGCSSLKSVIIPASASSVDPMTFRGTALENLSVAEGSAVYHSSGNCVIETESKTLVMGCRKSAIPKDGSVTSIGASAFAGCVGLSSVTIPKGVTSIGSYAFDKCADLQSVIIPSGVTEIADHAFRNCASLRRIVIPDGVSAIAGETFLGCAALDTIFIPASVKEVENNAFYACALLAHVWYEGDETARGAMTLGHYNSSLTGAAWHYERLSGDVNYDGEVTMRDVLLIRRAIAALVETDGDFSEVADVDGDGEATMKDVLMIRRMIAGLA
ncbi:MAG: leucine-rich repeat protein [Clostridia bacterium]|nr:leucine-rich repeat protein [Clostridia bacterium]